MTKKTELSDCSCSTERVSEIRTLLPGNKLDPKKKRNLWRAAYKKKKAKQNKKLTQNQLTICQLTQHQQQPQQQHPHMAWLLHAAGEHTVACIKICHKSKQAAN